ncbi:hypothetical protein ABTO85_19610, partial [Acinetobacter baumannii]
TATLLAGGSLLTLAACSGGSGGSTGPTAGGTPTPTPTPTPVAVTQTQSSRFLSQAAIGYAKSDVTGLASSSFDAWITAQFAIARPQKF